MKQRSRGRGVVGVVVALGALVTFAVFGGTGLAGSTAKPTKAQYAPGQYQNANKVTLCHKAKVTIRVSVSALPAHEAHGDVVGTCAAAAAKAKAKLQGRPRPRSRSRRRPQGCRDRDRRPGEGPRRVAGQRPGHRRQRQGERQELVPRGRLRRPHAIGTAGGREGRALTPGAYVVSTASSPPTGTTTQPSNWRSL